MGMYGINMNTPFYPAGGGAFSSPTSMRTQNSFPTSPPAHSTSLYGMPMGYGTVPINAYTAMPMNGAAYMPGTMGFGNSATFMPIPAHPQSMMSGSNIFLNYPQAQMNFGTSAQMPPVMPVQTMGTNGFGTNPQTTTYYPSLVEMGLINPFATASIGPMPIGSSSHAMNMSALPTQQMMASPSTMMTAMPTATAPMIPMAPLSAQTQQHQIGSTANNSSQMSVLEQRMMATLLKDPELAILFMMVNKNRKEETVTVSPLTIQPEPSYQIPEEVNYGDLQLPPELMSDMSQYYMPPMNTMHHQPSMPPQQQYRGRGFDASSMMHDSPMMYDESSLYMTPSQYDGAYGGSSSYNSSPLHQAMQTYRSTFAPGFSMNGELTASAKQAAGLDDEPSTDDTAPTDETEAPIPTPAPTPTPTPAPTPTA